MSAARKTLFPSRFPTVVGVVSLALLVFGIGGWAMNAQIDGAVIAPGRIVVDQNRQAVQHLDGGIVAAVLIKEGDTVESGAVLIRLDPTVVTSELSIVENRLYEIMARRGRVEAESIEADRIVFDPSLVEAAATDARVAELLEGQKSLFEARRATVRNTLVQLRNQQAQLLNQIEGIDAQIAASARQIALNEQETVIQQSLLDRGLTETSRVLSLQREAAQLSGLSGELTARRAQAMERFAAIDVELLSLQTKRQEEAIAMRRDLQVNELESRERRDALLTQLERMHIRAPVAGVVYDLRVFGPGAVVRPADPLLFIVPQDRPLVIEAEVKPSDVDKITAGMNVVLRFPAFSMRETPDLLGEVVRISPDAFNDAATGREFFRAEIALTQEEFDKLGPDQTLMPGMTVDCFIRTGEHTPFAYLTEPLVYYFSRAMREPS